LFESKTNSEEKKVLNRSKALAVYHSLIGMFIAVYLAVLAYFLCRVGSSSVNFEDPEYIIFWNFLWTSIYSITVIFLNSKTGKITANIVAFENYEYESDHENALIKYSFALGFINCYLGLFAATFEGKYARVVFILATILVFKQLILNIIANFTPICSKTPKFRKLEKTFTEQATETNAEDMKLHFEVET
jgi:hypothetical protein